VIYQSNTSLVNLLTWGRRSSPTSYRINWLADEECKSKERTKEPDHLATHQIGKPVIVKVPFLTIPSHSDGPPLTAYNTLHELACVLQLPTKTLHSLTEPLQFRHIQWRQLLINTPTPFDHYLYGLLVHSHQARDYNGPRRMIMCSASTSIPQD
jgi:hypothetical protein